VDYDYSYDGIMRSFEFSFARLGLNRIDILFVHDIGAYTHGEEANRRHFKDLMDGGLRALQELKDSGAIAAFGLGVNEVRICLDVMARAAIDCILLAGRYTLLDRDAARELLPLCERTGTSLVVGGVFNSGILATGPVPGAHFDYGPASPDILDRVGRMEAVARDHGVSLAAAALAFPLRHPSVATVLIGTAKPSSLHRNLDTRGTAVPDAAWAAFDALAINT
jgi:D-threo-aldose 1-dehydrogenase